VPQCPIIGDANAVEYIILFVRVHTFFLDADRSPGTWCGSASVSAGSPEHLLRWPLYSAQTARARDSIGEGQGCRRIVPLPHRPSPIASPRVRAPYLLPAPYGCCYSRKEGIDLRVPDGRRPVRRRFHGVGLFIASECGVCADWAVYKRSARIQRAW